MNLLRTKLDNGLKVMIRESHTAPVASFWIWYRVGNRNEEPGTTGISHWLEHMLFKGSERWPEGKADQSIARVGGVFNGFTWFDFTTYYETLPVERLSLALDIESDRMHNVIFTPEDVESERTVIVSERQGHENSPLFLLQESVMKTAYQAHPYRYETIGMMEDLQTITHADLDRHYHTHYVPGNAIVAVTGDFNAGEIERITERYFDRVPAGPEPPPVTEIEPPQTEERRTVVKGPGQTHYLTLAYHIPPARHQDYYALTVLNAVLSGGSGFLVGGGALSNYTSRLYRALVNKELAVDVYGSMMSTVDPGLCQLSATIWPGRDVQEVETALSVEVERLRNDLVSQEELEKAQRQARALFAYSSESISSQAFWLGFSEIFADYTWFVHYLENLSTVTAEDLRRVAQTYLAPTNRTVGWYVSNQAQT